MSTNPIYTARDAQTGVVIASRVTLASTRAERAIGLLRHSHLKSGEALWISPCRGVHTCFMQFAIDMLALDEDGIVVDAVSVLKPWRIRLPKKRSVSVLELPAGTVQQSRTRLGHRITIGPAMYSSAQHE